MKGKHLLLDKALDFIVETQGPNDFICEKMHENGLYDWCEKNCIFGLTEKCVIKFLKLK